MSKYIFTIVAACVIMLTSCQKQPTSQFSGNYSFKTSGVLCARQKTPDRMPLAPDEIKLKLPAESGQMDIRPISDNRDEDGVIITMNVVGGDMVVMRAKVQNDMLVIEPFKRTVWASIITGLTKRIEVTVSGEGHRYDNIILFSLDYTGSVMAYDQEYEIYQSDVDCRAKSNE